MCTGDGISIYDYKITSVTSWFVDRKTKWTLKNMKDKYHEMCFVPQSESNDNDDAYDPDEKTAPLRAPAPRGDVVLFGGDSRPFFKTLKWISTIIKNDNQYSLRIEDAKSAKFGYFRFFDEIGDNKSVYYRGFGYTVCSKYLILFGGEVGVIGKEFKVVDLIFFFDFGKLKWYMSEQVKCYKWLTICLFMYVAKLRYVLFLLNRHWVIRGHMLQRM